MTNNPNEPPTEDSPVPVEPEDRSGVGDWGRFINGFVVILLALPVLAMATAFSVVSLFAGPDLWPSTILVVAICGFFGLLGVYVGWRLISKSRMNQREE